MKCELVNKVITEDWGRELLKERGVADINKFLYPNEDLLQSFEALENISKGVELIKDTINSPKPYGLIKDCDCDGVTSAAIIYQYIKCINPDKEIVVFIHEGKQHGLEDMVDQIQKYDFDLVIAPDSSSNDDEYAAQLSCPVLAIDHHEVEEKEFTADNLIIINNQSSPNYKNKALTGAGVTYQFCRALDEAFNKPFSKDFIDLAALGIVGDMASVLSMENRYIISTGFTTVQNRMFKEMLEKQKFSTKGRVVPMTVAFYIVPLINALIRMGTQEEKERLFRAFVEPQTMVESGKRGEVGQLVPVWTEAIRECVNAKSKQTRIRDRAMENLEMRIFKEDLLENKILFIELQDTDDFPAVLNGLTATQMAAKYKKPTILARRGDDGCIKGSIRGLNNSELKSFKDFLLESKYFEYVQGHSNAAGCSIPAANYDKFIDYANEKLKDYNFDEDCHAINFSLMANDEKLSDLIYDLACYDDLWGTANDVPVVWVKGACLDASEIQVCGSRKDTVRFTYNGVTYIKFKAEELIEELKNHKLICLDVVGTTQLNEFYNQTTPQVAIQDYEIQDLTLAF